MNYPEKGGQPAVNSIGPATEVKDKQRDLMRAIMSMDDVVSRLSSFLDKMTGNDCKVEVEPRIDDRPPEPAMNSFRELMDYGPQKLRNQAEELHKLMECLEQEIY